MGDSGGTQSSTAEKSYSDMTSFSDVTLISDLAESGPSRVITPDVCWRANPTAKSIRSLQGRWQCNLEEGPP
jgi:hypothetical protein